MSINRAKFLELRDSMTFIPVIAIDCGVSGEDYNTDYLLGRAGYGGRAILLTGLSGGKKAECDPYAWKDRTFQVAHDWIHLHWDTLNSGDVIDVQFILGETKTPKRSVRYETSE